MLPESNPDFNSLALSSPSIAADLYERYGFLPTMSTTDSGVIAKGSPKTSREPAVDNKWSAQVDTLIKLFNSIEGNLASLRNRARDLRKEIRKKVKDDVDCSGNKIPDNVKSECQELIKTNTTYVAEQDHLAKTNLILANYENAVQTVSSADDSTLMKTAVVKKSEMDETHEAIAYLGSSE